MEQDDLFFSKEEEEARMELPPGFRFHPTDEELITHYLSKKVKDASFDARAIGEVDLNNSEPWDLPWRAKLGEKEWYFFCVRDRKYPTGLRTNRATEAGYWKATGIDKEIYIGKNLAGMKKTLVFYIGRAPKGEKSDWVMHEYRLLEGKFSVQSKTTDEMPSYMSRAKSEWVICRVFKRSCGGKKSIGGDETGRSSIALLPPLMDVASDSSARVTCFSIVVEDQKGTEEQQQDSVAADYFSNTNPMFQYSSTSSLISNYKFDLSKMISPTTDESSLMNVQSYDNFQGGFGSFVQLLQNDGGHGMKQQSCCKTEKEMLSNVSQETGITTDHLNPEISSLPSASTDCFWSY